MLFPPYEILTDKNNIKFSIYPIKYHSLWEHYKKQLSAFWKAEEIDFSNDYLGFITLDTDTQHVIKMILAFFANTDGIVALNISSKLMDLITINEARYAYQFQIAMENIHSETYSLMLDNLVRDTKEKEYLFDALRLVPSIKELSNWAFKWIDANTTIGHRIIAFACVESIFFSGAFATIYWLKKYKCGGSGTMLTGLFKSNEFISRDEGLHTEFAYELYKLVINKLDEKEAHELIIDAVKVAKIFNEDAIKVRLIGLNSELMNQYIEYVADRLSVCMGYSKIYNTKNPFSFMDTIGMMQKTNFHESRPTEYQSAHNGKSNEEFQFSFDDF